MVYDVHVLNFTKYKGCITQEIEGRTSHQDINILATVHAEKKPFNKSVVQLTMCLYPMLFFPAIVSITYHASLSGSPSPASMKRKKGELESGRIKQQF